MDGGYCLEPPHKDQQSLFGVNVRKLMFTLLSHSGVRGGLNYMDLLVYCIALLTILGPVVSLVILI